MHRIHGSLLLASLLLAGCEAPLEEDSAWYAPQSGDGAGKSDAWVGPSLYARYASRFEVRVRAVNFVKHPECASVPIVAGDACWNLATNHGAIISGLATVTQNGDAGALSAAVCNLRNTRYVNAKILEKAYPNLPPSRFNLKLALKDGGPAFDVTSDDGIFLFGYKPNAFTNPMTDELPRDKKDPRVGDPDQDGEAGLTFDDTIRVYVGTRSVSRFSGASNEAGEIRGTYRTSNVRNDFIVYGDGIWGVDPAIGRAEEALRSNRTIEQTMTTTLLPLRKPAPTCADVMAALPVLNLPIPPKE